MDLTPLLTAARYATAAYAVTATVLTTACLTLHLVTRVDQAALRRRIRRTSRPAPPARQLFVPLEQAPAT